MSADSATSSLPGMVCSAVQRIAPVVEQQRMARDTYRLRLRCPEIAAQILPGQFFMVRQPGTDDPLLGRPFALYDIYEEDGQPAGMDFGYVVIGKLTRLMAAWQRGHQAEIWGPLGNGFPLPRAGHLMIVAGGIGQTPFLAVVREALGVRSYGKLPREVVERPSRITMAYGVRTAELLAGVEDFTMPGVELQLATDDGSRGHRGFVTDLLRRAIDSDDAPVYVYCCGPEPMMHVTAEICAAHHIPCWLSLESPMACGFGACFSCVVRVRLPEGGCDYRRTCVEGPVFPADQLALDAPATIV